jgi:ABC-type lipoprotein export system ATPase subunit
MRLSPVQFAFTLLTRSLRITHEDLRQRDPAFLARVDKEVVDRAAHQVGAPMLMAADVPPMFTPFRLRELIIPNRVVVSPMCQYFADDGTVGDWHIVHLGSRAVGGAGLVMAEMTDVSRDARISIGCAGLYKPDSGEITFDGVHVNDSTRQAYRELIAAIFPDYHLFEKLYGIPDPDPAEVNRLLIQFRLHDKTHLTDSQFSTLDLSAGQRKRLALIVSLLEKRPILLLDEWAADQDPEFRRKFYYDLLPELKRAGETVVAITHDDRYLDEMDLPARRLRMEDGRFVAQQTVENR